MLQVLLRSGAMHYSRLARKAAVLVRRRLSSETLDGPATESPSLVAVLRQTSGPKREAMLIALAPL